MNLKEQILINTLKQLKTTIDSTLANVTDEQHFEMVKRSNEQMRIDLLDTNMQVSNLKAALKEIMHYAFDPETVASIADQALNGGKLPSKEYKP